MDSEKLAREWLDRHPDIQVLIADFCIDDLAALLDRVRDDEREACAKVCEEMDTGLQSEECAAAIRARGVKGDGVGMWKPIETAPKGNYAMLVTDPEWVEPPEILMLFPNEECTIVRWDWYYAEGGHGYTDGVAWVEPSSGAVAHKTYGLPLYWMAIPDPPE